MNDSKERGKGEGEDKTFTGAALPSPQTPLLKALEDMLHNRIAKKKIETHKHHEIAETEKIWTEIETLQWVLSEIRSTRRRQQAILGLVVC